MTQEDKELLLKDLCKRLPYGVYVEHTTSGFGGTLHDISVYQTYNKDDTIKDYLCYTNFFGDEACKIEFFKPYLFPLSSMTAEQKRNLISLFNCYVEITQYEIKFADYQDSNMDYWNKVFNWCYKNHFDINSLIPMGLANDATNKNIY